MKRNNPLYILILLAAMLLPLWGQQPSAQKSVRDLLRAASHFERRRQYQMAADYFSRAALQNPDERAAYLGAKRCLYQMSEYKAFIEFVEKIQSQKRELRYRVDIGDARFRLGERETALQLWQDILNENENQEQAYDLVGTALLETQQLDRAKRVFLNARKQFKNPTMFLHDLARIYGHQQKFDLMTGEYLRLLQASSKQFSFVESRILAYCEEPDMAEKIAGALRAQLSSFKDIHASIRAMLVNVYLAAADYERALEQVLVLEKNHPEKGRHFFTFAQRASKHEKPLFARRAYQLIIEQYPDSRYYVPAQHGLAVIYDDLGQYPKAIAAYKEFIRLFSKSSQAIQALLRMGDIYLNVFGDPVKAKTTYRQIIKSWPGTQHHHKAYFQLGKCYVAEGDLDRAEKIYTEFAKKKYGNAYYFQSMFELAKINLYQKQPVDCVAMLDKLIKANPQLSDEVMNDVLELKLLVTGNRADSTALVNYGTALYHVVLRQYEQSLAVIDTVVNNTDSGMREAFLFLAVKLYQKLNRPDKALKILEKMSTDKNSLYRERALMTMAHCYDREIKNKKKALKLYETVLETFPKSIYIEEARKRIRDLRQ